MNPPDSDKQRIDAHDWMKTKNPRLGKEDKNADLLPFEKL